MYDNKYELHLVCYSGSLKQNICGGHKPNDYDIRGIAMKDVQLSIQSNPLYPSQNEIDFIMCFRYTSDTSLKFNDTTSLATSIIISA